MSRSYLLCEPMRRQIVLLLGGILFGLVLTSAGCSGSAGSGPVSSTPPTQTAPSELEKDSTLSQPPKLAPPP